MWVICWLFHRTFWHRVWDEGLMEFQNQCCQCGNCFREGTE
jgi:hypothetical protein